MALELTAQAGLELPVILLPQSPQCWDYSRDQNVSFVFLKLLYLLLLCVCVEGAGVHVT